MPILLRLTDQEADELIGFLSVSRRHNREAIARAEDPYGAVVAGCKRRIALAVVLQEEVERLQAEFDLRAGTPEEDSLPLRLADPRRRLVLSDRQEAGLRILELEAEVAALRSPGAGPGGG